MAELEQRRQEAQAKLRQHEVVTVDVQHGRETSQTVAADSRAQGAVAVSSQVASGAQKWLILLVVVGGVIGTVSVVVFAAMTIASASSVAKQRQYR